MKQFSSKCIIAFILSIFMFASSFADDSSVAAAAKTDPSGYWLTKGGKSIVYVWQTKSGSYNGKVFKILNVYGQKSSDLCKVCTGDLANKPILGMTVIYGMQAAPGTPNKWINGSAFDPNSNKTYHANMMLSADGKTLGLHGYIGFSWIGRTENWTRLSMKAANAAQAAPNAPNSNATTVVAPAAAASAGQ